MKRKIIFGLLKAIAVLPLGLLYLFADIISPVLYHGVKYRRKVVRKNLQTSFPEKNLKEIITIEKKFYQYLSDQMVETLKLLHISDKEMRKRVRIINYSAVNEFLERGQNVVLLMGHYCNWEWVQEISRYFTPGSYMASIYHPLKNKMWDEFFISLRQRWGAHIIPMKKAPRVLMNKDNFPWVCGFIADGRPDYHNEDNCTEFLNHKTWFITGPEIIGDKVGAAYFYLEMIKKKRGYYDIIFHPLRPEESEINYLHTRLFWKMFETTITQYPAYWLWSHKRWKFRS